MRMASLHSAGRMERQQEKKGEGIQFVKVAAVPNVIVPAFA